VKEGLQILTGSRCMTPRQGILGQCKSSPASKKTTFLIFPVFLGILQWVLVWCRKKGAKTPSSVKDQLLVPQSDLECFTKFHFFSVRVGMSIPNCPAICLAPGRGPARSKGAIPRLDSNKNNFAIDWSWLVTSGNPLVCLPHSCKTYEQVQRQEDHLKGVGGLPLIQSHESLSNKPWNLSLCSGGAKILGRNSRRRTCPDQHLTHHAASRAFSPLFPGPTCGSNVLVSALGDRGSCPDWRNGGGIWPLHFPDVGLLKAHLPCNFIKFQNVNFNSPYHFHY